MLTVSYPWLFALLPLPLLIWWLAPAYKQFRRGLVVPFLGRLAALVGQKPARGATIAYANKWRWAVLMICWVCAVVAVSRPQIIEPPISKEIPVRDMLLAVDLSGSMETKDFTDAQGQAVTRLTAVKSVLEDFLAKRKGDRVGLIFFGSAAFVQAPFTEDLNVVAQLLDEAQVRMAGPQTAFGDALGLAINVFDRSTVNQRVLIALTDGNDTNSLIPPVKAAQIAKDKGIVIHTVAVGDPRAVGEDALDETTLRSVASTTGGMYSHASDRSQLEDIYQQLDQLETRKVETISHRPRTDVYWWPLLGALMTSLLFFVISLFNRHASRNFSRDSGRKSDSSSQPATVASVSPAAFVAAVSAAHLIRPEWLLILVPAAWIWWQLRRQTGAELPWRGIVAPNLLAHLLSGEDKKPRFGPLQWVGLTWLVVTIAIAGPSWKHEPSPFASDTAALAIVMLVAPSMTTEDIQPSRIQRATQKLADLLAIRGEAKTSLIAYAGSAHLVMPATRDAGIINNFAQALDPDIMPETGDNAAQALRIADKSLAAAGGGSIVWITDSIAPETVAALAEWRQHSATQLYLWPPLANGDELDALKQQARSADATVVELAADDSDIDILARAAKFANVAGADSDLRWAESGYWLTPLILVLLLPFFRRGWLVSIGRSRQ